MGVVSAAAVAGAMRISYPNIKLALVVGVCGGMPHGADKQDIMLGDVIISQALIQYDFGRQYPAGFERKTGVQETLGRSSPEVRSVQARLHTNRYKLKMQSNLAICLQRIQQKLPSASHPGLENDILYQSSYVHQHHAPMECHECSQDGQICEAALKAECEDLGCEVDMYVTRTRLADTSHPPPIIHFGVIGSGNAVMKSGQHRDQLAKADDIIALEMERAGVWDYFPSVVIKGVCDYADSHKKKGWQHYAAATAAACMKAFLVEWTPAEEPSILGPIDDSHGESVRTSKNILEENRTYLKKAEAWKQTRRERNCLQAFKTSSYQHFKDINKDRLEGTCRWVLDHPHFQRWYDSSHNDLLWISADPGCGKSVLSKFLVDHKLVATSKSTTCYYFFKDNDQQDRLAPALCAILHQLFSQQPHLLRHALSSWEMNGDNIREEIEMMWRILLAAASDETAGSITCVLDALDECRDNDRRDLISKLSHFYQKSPKIAKHTALKFLVTSRPYDGVQRWFGKATLPQIWLRGEIENESIHDEINQVIDRQLQELASEFELSAPYRNQLSQRLRSMEHRTYLWLYLAIEEIRNKFRDSPNPEEELIENLPASVEKAYELILQRITDSQRSLARRILVIIVGARRPLTIGEAGLAINAAIAYRSDQPYIKEPNISHLARHLREWCGLFVFINHSQLFLIHQTAKEFLLTDFQRQDAVAGLWKASLVTAEVEREMAIMCVTYLRLATEAQQSSARDVNVDDLQNARSEFFDYCARYWTSHLHDHDIIEHPKLLEYVLDLYDADKRLFHLWRNVAWKAKYPTREIPPHKDQHVISAHGHAVVLAERYKRKVFDLEEAVDDNYGTALMFAAESGSKETVRLLLDMGANANVQGKYNTSLLVASLYGHEEVVRMLIDGGADVNAKSGDFGTALDAATLMGHEKIIRMLLDQGAINDTDRKRAGKALILASRLGQNGLVRRLLDKAPEILNDEDCRSQALKTAEANGHPNIVQMLLDESVNTVTDREGL